MRTTPSSPVDAIIGSVRVLIAEDNSYLRKLVRNLLVNVGVKNIDEVEDGLAAFEATKSNEPDILIVDWDLPLITGADLLRIIRTPGMLAKPALPVIMLGASAERWRIAEAKRLGVNAYLTMPISGKALLDRIVTILAKRPAGAPEGERGQPANSLFMV
jgi:two-component system, chemotaxis family, chemotaxis protein CheY